MFYVGQRVGLLLATECYLRYCTYSSCSAWGVLLLGRVFLSCNLGTLTYERCFIFLFLPLRTMRDTAGFNKKKDAAMTYYFTLK